MRKNEINIDFQLIRKKFKSELSAEEEKQFQEWLKADVRHQKYYEKAVFYLKEGYVFNRQEIDIAKNRKEIRKKLIHTKRHRLMWLQLAGAVAAAVVISFAIFQWGSDSEQMIELAENSHYLEPGSKRAELILSNGQVVILGQEANSITESDGTVIKTDSNSLDYGIKGGADLKNIYNEVKVKRGEEFSLRLSDGTRVWLNSMSTIRFPVQFADNRREVTITGEVYFEVEHDAGKPFVVHTPVHDISVLGTSFNVSCYENDETVQTTLVEGKVKISEIPGGLKSAVLEPGNQYAYNKAGLKAEIRTVNTEIFTAWTKGYFIFEEQTLEDIFRKLERWYKIEVFFSNKEVKYEYFTGSLQRFEDVSTLLSMIEDVSDVNFKIEENRVVVY